MQTISLKTMLYEQKTVENLKDKKWHQIFEKNINKIKMKFNFANIIKLYTVKKQIKNNVF